MLDVKIVMISWNVVTTEKIVTPLLDYLKDNVMVMKVKYNTYEQEFE